MSYTGRSLGQFYPSAEMKSVYSPALAGWAKILLVTWNYITVSKQMTFIKSSLKNIKFLVWDWNTCAQITLKKQQHKTLQNGVWHENKEI